MTPQDLQNLRMIFISVEQGDLGILKALGIMVSNSFYSETMEWEFTGFSLRTSDTLALLQEDRSVFEMCCNSG
jgi:hypothetical protein